ncbi:MAG: 2-C-methyl-D-erythritol 2,4-cyclodiphosphate synthase [Alphaproteobacteria bacterium]
MDNVVLIVAAGTGQRFAKSNNAVALPKQYTKVNDSNILAIILKKFLDHPDINGVKVIINKEHLNLYSDTIKDFYNSSKILSPVYGGANRQESIYLGLQDLIKTQPTKVLIHDGVRPFISHNMISQVIKKLESESAVIVAKPIYNTIKKLENGKLITIDRDNLYSVETPQAFIFDKILAAHTKLAGKNFTDDAALFEELGLQVEILSSTEKNTKITTIEDLEEFMEGKKYKVCVGSGFDAHKFSDVKNGFIILGGIKIPFEKSIIAHSDGDVVLHALVDAMLGTISAGDIGMHFSPSDERWKNADSSLFVKHALNLIKSKAGIINNADITIIGERPKIGKYREEMKKNIAKLLEIDSEQVNIKATTTERMGFTGREEGLAAQAVIAVEFPITKAQG